ncbi:MAG: tRNA (cytidine(34)-2'-O)-methyltransferase [Lentisphaeria bacterium]|nr:tRNA (cytidine(34)-2'-O)-methyltransferase [Lentisphaeria bacterium]
MEKFNIVLFAPEIPQNTGTIGRLAVSTSSRLHLIEPLGFSLEDKFLKRAGLDYWEYLAPSIHPSWESFLAAEMPERMFFISTHGKRDFFDAEFRPGDYLVFGRESSGLPEEMHRRYPENFYRIPMPGEFNRSLNLANAASIVLYEALRQNRDLWQDNVLSNQGR